MLHLNTLDTVYRKLATTLVLVIMILSAHAQPGNNSPGTLHISGAMRNVMWKGKLAGTIALDTITDKTHLYGLGPVEFLTGEILILDGRTYVSKVASPGTMKLEETFAVKAPFFVYANVAEWNETYLPDSIRDLRQFETYLIQITKSKKEPFAFKLTGVTEKATLHIVNLPPGTKVSSPDDAHKGKVNYELVNEEAEIIGFFSTQHQSVFTHHDTYLHMHLITADRSKMGHVDEALLKKGTAKLYLPVE